MAGTVMKVKNYRLLITDHFNVIIYGFVVTPLGPNNINTKNATPIQNTEGLFIFRQSFI